MSTLGDRLKDMIERSGRTRENFAALCGVSRSQLYKYLNDSQKPGTPFFEKISKNFQEANVSWLITGEGPGKHLGMEFISDTEGMLELDCEGESLNTDTWSVLSMRGGSFETNIAEMLILQALKELRFILNDSEREKLASHIAANKVWPIYKTIKEHLQIVQGMKENNEKKDILNIESNHKIEDQ